MKVDNPNFAGASFHHLGVACKDIDEALGYLRHLLPAQFEESDTIHDSALKADLKLISAGHNFFFELVAGPAVSAFLQRNVTYYHTCFLVDDIAKFARAMPRPFVPVTSRTPAILFEGRHVQFFQSSLGLVELLESE